MHTIETRLTDDGVACFDGDPMDAVWDIGLRFSRRFPVARQLHVGLVRASYTGKSLNSRGVQSRSLLMARDSFTA